MSMNFVKPTRRQFLNLLVREFYAGALGNARPDVAHDLLDVGLIA